MIGHHVDKEIPDVLGLAELLALSGVLHTSHRAALIPGNNEAAMKVDIVVIAVWNDDMIVGLGKILLLPISRNLAVI